MKMIKIMAKHTLTALFGPERTLRVGRNYYELEALLRCWASPIYRQSVKRLRTYANRHAGERCFIIGNGPSLRKMDLAPLKDEITFGLNRIYLLFDSIGFTTTYYVSCNKYVIEQCAEEIAKLPDPKFISWKGRHLMPFSSKTIFVRSRSGPRFCTDIAKEGIWEGATVTYMAMQIAYYMGFQKVILIGVDHSFQTEGRPRQLVVSEGDDPNHFHPNYFGKGYRWQLPDLETSELAYGLAKRQFELAGRAILDATVEGKLQVFPKVRYDELFKNPLAIKDEGMHCEVSRAG
jgi:hypothetical protein